MRNVHRMFITYTRNLETRKTRNDFLVLYYLWVKGFDIRKRDAQSFSDDFSISLPNTCAPIARLREQAKVNRLLPRQDSTQLSFSKSQIPPRASGAWRHPHSVAPFPIWAIVTSLNDPSVPPVRVNTCVNVAPK